MFCYFLVVNVVLIVDRVEYRHAGRYHATRNEDIWRCSTTVFVFSVCYSILQNSIILILNHYNTQYIGENFN